MILNINEFSITFRTNEDLEMKPSFFEKANCRFHAPKKWRRIFLKGDFRDLHVGQIVYADDGDGGIFHVGKITFVTKCAFGIETVLEFAA